jgi:DNA-binding transcriptional LysR family regulator
MSHPMRSDDHPAEASWSVDARSSWPPRRRSRRSRCPRHTGHVDLRQLAALVAIADSGSFSSAAASLHTVQSNVSGHIKRLERELGVQLVDRQTGRLTEEGVAVEARARAVQAELEAIVADVAALRADVVGSVRLGMIATTARWLVPLLLDKLAAVHPGVRLVTTEATSSALGVLLAAGGLDCAVVNLPLGTPELKLRPLFDEDIVLLISKDHPLAIADALHIKDLEGVELILPAPRTGFRQELDEAAHQAGMTLCSNADIDGLRLLATLALRGYGPALLPATTLWDLPEGLSDLPEGYRTISVAGLPLRHVGMALRKRGKPSAATQALISVLESVLPQYLTSNSHLHEAVR